MRRTLFAHRLRLGTGGLLLAFMVSGGCKKTQDTLASQSSPSLGQPPPIQTASGAEPAIVACTLLTAEEVAAIQKATITDAKASSGPSGNLVMSQCYYTAKEPNMAVSLALIEPAQQSATGAEAKEYWENSIRQAAENHDGETEENDKQEERAGRGEEKELRSAPKKIDRIGDEAYWSGNRFGGALYVLKRNVIVRVSVGGPDNEQTKIEKSKALAEKALTRLP